MTGHPPLFRPSAALLLASLVLGLRAWAEDPSLPAPPTAPTIPTAEPPKVPKADLSKVKIPKGVKREHLSPTDLHAVPYRVIGFSDRAGDCPALDARAGRCVERVDFLDLTSAWSAAGPRDRDQRALLQTISASWLRLWEILAYRWFRDGDLPQTTIQKDGFQALPTPADTWDAATPQAHGHVALPARDHWLDQTSWTGEGGVFPPVRYAMPDGLLAAAPEVILSGRFARRLGVDGHPHDYEIMDGDRQSSGPFFEQMYPFQTAWMDRDATAVPLAHFAFPRRLTGLTQGDPASLKDQVHQDLADVLLTEDSYDAFQGRARREFESFVRLLGVQIAQYALEDHTTNQMRVLAALTLLRNPPGELERKTGRTRDLVAASLGQTDADEEAAARMDRSAFALQQGFALRYEQLPESVVSPWLHRVLASNPDLPTKVRDAWNARLFELIGDLIRPNSPPPDAMDPDAIDAWLRAWLQPGKDPDVFLLDAERLALAVLVEALPEPDRVRVETWVFLDHVNAAISAGLDQGRGERAKPQDVVAVASDQWQKVIGLHGQVSRPMAQGLGAVDPTSICTTADGRAALVEPSIGAVDVDLLVAAKRGLTRPEDVLWETRDQLPFLSVDDPDATAPGLRWIVDLPEGQSLYRLRWHLWSGWHLLWTSEALATGDRRLAVRTAAFCSDLVLAAPDLAATVVRAALLDGQLQPSTPVSAREARAAPTSPTAPPADELPLAEQASWLQSLGRSPLRALADQQKGLLVAVVDARHPAPGALHLAWSMATPYLKRSKGAGHGQVRQVSTWAWYLPAAAAAPPTLVAPAWRPDASVATDVPRPRWRQVPTLDWNFVGGLDAMPLRYSETACTRQSSDQDVVDGCDSQPAGLFSEGVGADLAAMTTVWLRADRRIAAEGGLDMRLGITPPGHAWIYGLRDNPDPTDPLADGPDYTWSFKPQIGIIGGLRWAPVPGGLWRRGSGTLPWGADRPDGTSALGRVSGGFRLGLLYGPAYNGAELTGLADGWMAWALRSARNVHASFTPYHPGMWLGPFLSAEISFRPPFDNETSAELRYLELNQGYAFQVGLRGQLRLQKPVALPGGS